MTTPTPMPASPSQTLPAPVATASPAPSSPAGTGSARALLGLHGSTVIVAVLAGVVVAAIAVLAGLHAPIPSQLTDALPVLIGATAGVAYRAGSS